MFTRSTHYRWQRCAGSVAVLAVAIIMLGDSLYATAQPASMSAVPEGQHPHCVGHAEEQSSTTVQVSAENYTYSFDEPSIVCFSTVEDAMYYVEREFSDHNEAQGQSNERPSLRRESYASDIEYLEAFAASNGSILGIMWDNPLYAGATMTWAGQNGCRGLALGSGWVIRNLGAIWNDKASSSNGYNECDDVWHYENTDQGGQFINCSRCATLAHLNSGVSSILFRTIPPASNVAAPVISEADPSVVVLSNRATLGEVRRLVGDRLRQLSPGIITGMLVPANQEQTVRLARQHFFGASALPYEVAAGENPSITERSARRRDGDVEIFVSGDNRDIDGWYTSAWQYPHDGCIRPSAYFNRRFSDGTAQWSDAHYLGDCVAVPPGQVWIWDTAAGGMPYTFETDFDACNQWTPSGFSGYPCVRVFQR